MPKLIDYPRTSYHSAWEVAEVVDDTGGKCELETCARKLNRKVSGSFKAIVGSAVKFGLLTSKREVLSTTTLFRRIKHAYDKEEELLFHREAFLTPPMFTQLCRKFRNRELPVAMLDVLLIREFEVEEINAPHVAKAFVDGARMVRLLDEQNVVADIDQLAAQQAPRRELASPPPPGNTFRRPAPGLPAPTGPDEAQAAPSGARPAPTGNPPEPVRPSPAAAPSRGIAPDTIASLFGLGNTAATAPEGPKAASTAPQVSSAQPPLTLPSVEVAAPGEPLPEHAATAATAATPDPAPTHHPDSVVPNSNAAHLTRLPGSPGLVFRLHMSGPGISTELDIADADDLQLVRALLDKIERRLTNR